MDVVHAAGMDETYGTTFYHKCFDIHYRDDDTDHDSHDDADDETHDNTNGDADDDTDGGGRGNLYTVKVTGCCSQAWYLVIGPWSSVLGP